MALGVPGGAEILIEAAKQASIIMNKREGMAVLNMDMLNCFNLIDRVKMLKVMAKSLPEFYGFYHTMFAAGNHCITTKKDLRIKMTQGFMQRNLICGISNVCRCGSDRIARHDEIVR